MPELIFQTIIAKPRAEVWSQLRDLREARHYVPGVIDIEYATEQREGVGASRKVHMQKRGVVDETVIAWEDAGGFTLKIHKGDQPAAPFKWATFRYQISDAPGGHTQVRCMFQYEMAMGLLGRLLDVLLVRPAIKRSNEAVVANMKKYYETGEIANRALSAGACAPST